MIRLGELAIFLAPIAAFLLWRAAIARGLDGPPPRQLAMVFASLMLVAILLIVFAERDRLPPGQYVPAQLVNGQIVPPHTLPPGP